MAQFTPPNFPNPMVMSLLQDQQRQAQWERTQNARIQQEQRNAQVKLATEDRKRLWDLGLKLAENAIDPSRAIGLDGRLDPMVAGRLLANASALGREKDVRESLQPLADIGASIGPYKRGTIESPEIASLRQAYGTGIAARGIENQPGYLAQLAVQQSSTIAARREDIREREGQLSKEARLPVAKRKVMERDERRLRGIANQLTAQGKHGTQEWQDAAESYLRAKMQLGKFVSAEGRTISISDEGVEITEGGSGRMITQQMRAIENINNVDAIREDARVALSMIEANPSIAGTAGGLTNIMNTFAGVMTDVANMASGDILADMVDPELADHLESNIMGDGEIQGLKLIEMAMAYSWVRSKRGSRRITMEEYKKALENLRLHGGWTSSNQVESRLKWFLRDMNRKARQNRSKMKSAWGLDVPDTSYEPLPSGVQTKPTHRPIQMRPEVEQGLQGLGLEGP